MANLGPNKTSRSLNQTSTVQSLLPPRQTPFDKLAIETMEEIFISACPSVNIPSSQLDMPVTFNQQTDPWILSMVCKRWNNITKAYHPLWSTIDIFVDGIKPWYQWGFRQFSDCLRRSCAHLLTIHVKGPLPYDLDYDPAPIFSEILTVMIPHCERWKSIEFGCAPRDALFHMLDFLNGGLPYLQSLALRSLPTIVYDAEGGILQHAPSLTRICVGTSEFPLRVLRNMPWAQLTEVVFDHAKFESKSNLRETLGALSQSVTRLSILNALCPHFTITTAEQPITLSKLRQLRVEDRCRVGILNILICPLLKHLEIENEIDHPAKLPNFLDKSLCALTHIQFIKGDPLKAPPSYHLVLHNAALSTLESISLVELEDELVDLLVFGPHRLLPSLETLHYRLNFWWAEANRPYVISRVEGLRKIIDSRTQKMLSPSIDGPHSGFIPNNAEISLKNAFLDFDLLEGPGCFDGNDPPMDIETLWSFCLSRNIRGHCRQQVYHPN